MALPKLWTYSSVSTLALCLFIANAIYKHHQFYLVMVHLSISKISRVLVANMSFVLLALFGQFIKWMFLGELKPREIEKVNENTFYYVATTCLALTIFREAINSTILSLFVLCLFLKIFHWIAQCRQEYIEQSIEQRDGSLTSVRLLVFLCCLLFVDIGLAHLHTSHLLVYGLSVRLLLALEFLIMVTTSAATILRMVLHAVDASYQHRWENTGKYRFYLEIMSELIQATLYLAFFGVLLFRYGFPLHLTREVYITLKSFKKTVEDFLRYRKLTACLDTRYPDATPEEIQRDPQCIICYDDMVLSAKKLSCGHIFHKHCLKSWMERNNKCPLCNKPTLLDEPPIALVDPPVQPPPAFQAQPPFAAEQQRRMLRVFRSGSGSQRSHPSSCSQSSTLDFGSSSLPQQQPQQGTFPWMNASTSRLFHPIVPPGFPPFNPCQLSSSGIEAYVEYQRQLAHYHENLAKACRELADKLSSVGTVNASSVTNQPNNPASSII